MLKADGFDEAILGMTYDMVVMHKLDLLLVDFGTGIFLKSAATENLKSQRRRFYVT